MVQNAPDVQDEEGKWLKYYAIDLVQHVTRSCGLWQSLQKRATPGGSEQLKTPSYGACTIDFEGFQEFAEWCQDQYGYWNKDVGGMYWQLDKDILVRGNKVYGPDTCCFVPSKINNVVRYAGRPPTVNNLPIGVKPFKTAGRFTAYQQVGDSNKYLGIANCPLEAHKLWQAARIERLSDVMDEFYYLPTNVLSALKRWQDELIQDLENNIETKRYEL
jgi:hypothetical protein